jgi:hypothetical protein
MVLYLLILLQAGAMDLRSVLEKKGMIDELPGMLKTYMEGLTNSFRIALTCIAVGTVAACFFEWRSVQDEAAKEEAAELGLIVTSYSILKHGLVMYHKAKRDS